MIKCSLVIYSANSNPRPIYNHLNVSLKLPQEEVRHSLLLQLCHCTDIVCLVVMRNAAQVRQPSFCRFHITSKEVCIVYIDKIQT